MTLTFYPGEEKPKSKSKAQPQLKPETQPTPEVEEPAEQPKLIAPKKLPKPLTSRELGRKLRITNVAVRGAYNRSQKNKNPNKAFAKYSQKRDPDKLAWVFEY